MLDGGRSSVELQSRHPSLDDERCRDAEQVEGRTGPDLTEDGEHVALVRARRDGQLDPHLPRSPPVHLLGIEHERVVGSVGEHTLSLAGQGFGAHLL